MSDINADDVKAAVGTVLSLDGKISGFGVHLENTGQVNTASGTPTVEFKLNENSLRAAETKSGAHAKTPARSSAAFQHSQTAQSQADNRYAGLFGHANKKNSDRLMAMTPAPSLTHHNNYSMLSPMKNPAERSKQRRLLELSKTFSQIRAQQKVHRSFSLDSLPEGAKKKLVQKAVETGLQHTPFGPVVQAAKKVGLIQDTPKPANKKNNLASAFNKWEGALMPGSYISTPTPFTQD